ncbi:hypothetical protein [Desulfosarcina sp.]|uniref:hypothetical protein n=1 Tax=Desulfosarcina sp. TaxID=2027861 RepID=UPI0035673E0B
MIKALVGIGTFLLSVMGFAFERESKSLHQAKSFTAWSKIPMPENINEIRSHVLILGVSLPSDRR